MTQQLALLHREIQRRDRRIRPLKQVRAELKREHRAHLRSLGRHLTRAIADRDRSTRETNALRAELDAARREIASLHAARDATPREGIDTKGTRARQRATTSSASSHLERRGQHVDLSGMLEAELKRARTTAHILRADLDCTRLERDAAAQRAEVAQRRAFVSEVLLMCVMSTPLTTPMRVFVQIPYRAPDRPFPSDPVHLSPVVPSPMSISSVSASSRVGTVHAPAHASEDTLGETAARPSAPLNQTAPSPSHGVGRSNRQRELDRVSAVLSMCSVGVAVARRSLGDDSLVGWRLLLLVGLVSALVSLMARTRGRCFPSSS